MFFHRDKTVTRQRNEHCISRANIDPDALKVLYRLANSGYTAFLVGGSVRDLLLGRQPKDFDVGTDARPNDIRRLFRNCFLIGRRFRLAHIVFGRKVIETSTFRRQPDESESENGLYQTEDNTFGSPQEDAKRRDFTVNGLFYDIKTFAVIDYVGGLKDLEKKVLRCIGDPNIRFREDPVRMMRAVKFSARLGFTLDRACRKAILKHHADILNASVPRVCEEVFRLFTYGSSCTAFRLMWEFKLLQDILPEVSAYIDRSGGDDSPLWTYLAALDNDPQTTDLSNGVRAACLYYPIFLEQLEKEEASAGRNGRVNRQHIARNVFQSIADRLHVPKATFFTAVALMDVQRRFSETPRKGGRNSRFIFHPGFPEAIAFQRILLAAEKGDTTVLNAWQALYDQEFARPDSYEDESQPNARNDGSDEDVPRDAEPLEPQRRRRHRHHRRPEGRPDGARAADQPPRQPSAPVITVTEVPAPAAEAAARPQPPAETGA
jgi:poly(A) polymerase